MQYFFHYERAPKTNVTAKVKDFGFIFVELCSISSCYFKKKNGKIGKIRKKVSEFIFFGSNTNTKVGLWFRFQIPKPGLSCTLIQQIVQIENFSFNFYLKSKIDL